MKFLSLCFSLWHLGYRVWFASVSSHHLGWRDQPRFEIHSEAKQSSAIEPKENMNFARSLLFQLSTNSLDPHTNNEELCSSVVVS